MEPTIIISSGRCGSTLLSQMLNEHPDIAVIQEFWSYRPNRASLMRPGKATGSALWEELSMPMSADLHKILRAGMIPTALAVHGPEDNVLLRTTLPALVEEPANALLNLKDFIMRLGHHEKAHHYEEIFSFLAGLRNKPIWVERTGGSLRYAEALISLFPNARFIHLYRDGRDSALSMSRHPTFVYGYVKRTAPSMLPDVCNALLNGGLSGTVLTNIQTAFASEWSTNVLNTSQLLRNLPENRTLEVRFETFLEQPQAEFGRILNFILGNQQHNDAWIETQVPRLRTPICHHRQLDSNYASLLKKSCEAGLATLGYI